MPLSRRWLLALLALAPGGCQELLGIDATRLAGDGGVAGDDARVTSSADAAVDCAGKPRGTACGPLHVCLDGACRASTCGDSVVDERAGEECEDGNVVAGDGCDPGCLLTCIADDGCDDGDLCTGQAICRVDHTCSSPPALPCDDGDPCTVDSCDPVAGCRSALIDADGDGFAPLPPATCAPGTPAGDCDDGDPTVHPGAFDGCDGQARDNDCDGVADEDGDGRWYADCDGDGFAAAGASYLEQCAAPGGPPAACPGGTWTTLAPVAAAVDCDDARADTHPGAAEIIADGHDQSCDGLERCYRDRDDDDHRTDEIRLTTDIGCAGSDASLAIHPLEWKTAAAAHVCCDENAFVHRDQPQFFAPSDDLDGNQACPAGRRWDYDCDGAQERRWTQVVGQCLWTPNGCTVSDGPPAGWSTGSAVPGCGAPAAPWASDCRQNGVTSCAFSPDAREQECR